MQVEQVFDIRDAEHIAGTNRYVFKYPEHWRRIPNKQLTIGIRSIKRINSSIILEWNMFINSSEVIPTHSYTCKYRFQIGPQENLVTANMLNSIPEALYKRYKQTDNYKTATKPYLSNVFQIEYDVNESALIIIDHNDYDMTFSTDSFTFLFFKRVYTSPDFNKLVNIPTDFFPDLVIMIDKSVTSSKDNQPVDYSFYIAFMKKYEETLKHVEILFRSPMNQDLNPYDFDPRYPYGFKFKNTPKKGDLLIKSSIPDQTNGQYLGYTNEKFEPIKYYQIHNSDSKFWIDLYEGITQIPVELCPNDRIIIEAVVMTEPHLFK
jgi:hypothetical protein